MSLYDSETFTRSLIPAYIKKEVAEVIETAVMFGWKMHISGASSVTIISHDERKKYHFSANGRASNSLTRIKRDVIRFGDPKKLLIADSIIGIKDKDIAQMAMTLLPNLGDKGTVVDHRPALEAEAREKAKATPAAMPQKKEPVSSDSEPERHIVSEKPMVAKASEGKGYDSKVAIERTWSDGTIDYKCVDCDYSAPNRLSIRSHRTRADHQKRGSETKRFKAEVPNAASYAPRQTRIDALAAHLAGMFADGEFDPEKIARESLTWVHEQSKKGTILADEREPMTPDETLDRIRALLDNGAQVAAITERDEQIDALQGEVVIYKGELDKLHERVDELESFIDLANTLRRKDTA